MTPSNIRPLTDDEISVLKAVKVEVLNKELAQATCPGSNLHTTPTRSTDCLVFVNDGIPRLHCMHQNCGVKVALANQEIRQLSEILREHDWPLAALSSAAPVSAEFSVESHWMVHLTLFGDNDVVWCADDVRQSGRPEDAIQFRSVAEWIDSGRCPGQFTCPSVFKAEVHSRSDANVDHRKFLVVESDILTRDQVGAVFRYLQKAWGMHLRAVVDTAGKSLHGWFDRPSNEVVQKLRQLLPNMGCDGKMFSASQPCRLAGAQRDGGGYQKLLYFDNFSPTPANAATPPPTATSNAAGASAAVLPPLYYDQEKKDFIVPQRRGGWVRISERMAARFMKTFGGKADMVDIITQQSVDFVGKLAGYTAGPQSVGPYLMLVTESPKFIAPVAGNWPLIKAFAENLFGSVQLPHVYGWLKVALQMYSRCSWRPGQAFVMCGPKNSGKNLFRKIITAMMGGRVADPYQFMTRGTGFNSDMFGAETLAIEDQAESTSFKARRAFAGAIKNVSVNEEQRYHRKFADPINLHPRWRLIISLNDHPERILVLPPMGTDIADKVMLFKVRPGAIPRATNTTEEFESLWRDMALELPAFVHFLTHEWTIDESIQCGRFGVTHYHDTDLLGFLQELAPEQELIDLIDAVIFGTSLSLPPGCKIRQLPWEGKASELERKLKSDKVVARSVENLLKNSIRCGIYLERLRDLMPERISKRSLHGNSIWRIEPPDMLVIDSLITQTGKKAPSKPRPSPERLVKLIRGELQPQSVPAAPNE